MSDLEKLRALKKAIMDGQLPGYDATPKPQALEALYSPRGDFTGRTNDPATDTSYQPETGYSLDNQSTTRSLDEIPRPIPPTSMPHTSDTTATVPPQTQEISGSNQVANDVARSPTIDRPAATLPLTDNHAQSVTIPRAVDETQTASPTSMIMSPTEPRLVHQSSITDMEIDSPPPSAGPPPIQEVSQSNSAPPPIESIQRDQDKSGPPEPKLDKQPDAPPAFGIPHPEQRPESGSPVATEPSRGRYTYSDEPRRQEDSRYVDYRSRPSYTGNRRSESGEIERTGPRSPESNSQRPYRRGSSPNPRQGLSGPPRPSNDVRYDYYESGQRFPSNRSPPRPSFSESRGYDSGPMDGGRVMPREPYPGPPGDRSSASSRNFPYDREPSRFGGTVDERRQSTLPESSDGRPLNQSSPQRRVPEGQRTQPPVNPSPPTTSSLSGPPQSRASDGGRYFYPPPPQSSLPPGAGRSIPLELNTGSMNVKAEAPDDGDIDRRSTTPRSVGESGAPRSSSFIPGRVPDGLPSRPPPSVDEPLTPRSSLMPDRIAPDSRQYVPLAARLTSPNDYAQRGQRSGPPTRGPPVDTRRPADELRYSSPTDRDSWGQSGRADEPLRRETAYPRPDDARDYSRVVPRAEWERSRSPQGDRYGPTMSSRPPVPPAGYPYGRDRSLSPPRRSGTYPRSAYPDVDDNRGTKRPRQELIDPDYRRPPPPDWRPRDEYDPRAPPPPPRQPYVDPRGPYARPSPPDAYRSYDREPYPPDNRPRPPPLPYGNDRDRYPPDAEWSSRPPYRR
ncbi:hypothetical protein FRC05_008413 [Tulasnella sp. 425]|nr:hypothetical protein FRC05_008413 [Tulasnella sp. 425]